MIQRFCLRVRVNKLQHHKGIWLPILYHELNRDDTILVQGWVRDQEPGTGSWHVWCETAGGELIDPQVSLLEMDDIWYKLIYTTDKPENPSQDEDIVNQWELYEQDPPDFWKNQTSDIKSFRSKIFTLIKKNKF